MLSLLLFLFFPFLFCLVLSFRYFIRCYPAVLLFVPLCCCDPLPLGTCFYSQRVVVGNSFLMPWGRPLVVRDGQYPGIRKLLDTAWGYAVSYPFRLYLGQNKQYFPQTPHQSPQTTLFFLPRLQ